MVEGTGDTKSLEELGANKPKGHEAAGGSVHAHRPFLPSHRDQSHASVGK